MTDFERQVLADLAQLKAQMHDLLGDGQPGRLRRLEERVERHESLVQRATGIGALIAGLLTLLHVALEYFRVRH
jgi:hypothetical protein